MTQQSRLYFRDDNPTGNACLILLHGLGVNGDSWMLQMPALIKAGFRLVTPDIRGFGRSAHLPRRPTIAALAADISDLCAQLHLKTIALVGISMGGAIALQTALDNPDLVDRLVLINTFARLRPRDPRRRANLVFRFLLAHLISLRTQANLVSSGLFPSPEQALLRQAFVEQVLQSDLRSYRAVSRSLARFDVRARLQELPMPVLVVSGACDRTVPLDCQRQLAAGIPGCRQAIIADAGHGLIVEKPDLFNAVLLDFLEVPDSEVRHAA